MWHNPAALGNGWPWPYTCLVTVRCQPGVTSTGAAGTDFGALLLSVNVAQVKPGAWSGPPWWGLWSSNVGIIDDKYRNVKHERYMSEMKRNCGNVVKWQCITIYIPNTSKDECRKRKTKDERRIKKKIRQFLGMFSKRSKRR